MKIVVSVYALNKDGKLLMVQEGYRGMWTLPGGHLSLNEKICDTAVRKVKTETGFDVELTGILGIQNCTNIDDPKEFHILHIGFSADIIGVKISFDQDEVMTADFIDPKSVLQMPAEQFRGVERKECIERLMRGEILPLETISNFDKGVKS